MDFETSDIFDDRDTPASSLRFFESVWLKKAKLAWTIPAETPTGTLLEKVRRAVEELSNLFTTERPKDGHFRDYMSDAKLLAAYGLFFFPQSFARAQFAVSRLLDTYAWTPCADPDSAEPLRILDLGSGASPCGFAAAHVLAEKFPRKEIIITALDRSRDAVATAQEIAKSFSEHSVAAKITVNPMPADLRKLVPAKLGLPKQDLILLGWSLNEAVPAPDSAIPFLKNLATLLSPSGALLVLEPALKITAERLQQASDFFAGTPGNPFFRLAPELGAHPCPLLKEGIFWNHEARKWEAPETLEFLNRTLFREIGVLKFSWCALGKVPGRQFSPSDNASAIVRLVSPLEATKTCLRFVGVNPHGEKISVEIPTRGLSKNEVKKHAAQWERGDIAELAGTLTPLGTPGHFRLAGSLKTFCTESPR